MNTTIAGLFVGLVLGLVAVFGSFLAMLGVAFFGALGLTVGAVVDGRLDLTRLLSRERARR
ncbi:MULTISPECIES: hypothetical protein [Nesterenkonia]|uniref:Mg/Co/Ni transporter MgtE n=1 Tax=Nesterenkonia xinjiangensis TaxID=225327 RepID=A0A7Z0K9B0_9MICC|nr:MULTISPECIES: hypothetical protein [Nesterenkonia]MDZ5076967.1 hypothetical protein [Nesterenkonia sp. HG001]NYJ77030.1 Mg/Co/Ni transporter MgtE [Nesterenkonia xinjiangensis]